MPTNIKSLIARIQAALTPDLLSKTYQSCANDHPVAGHCYIAAEALFHALGGKAAGLTAQVAKDPTGGTHWWLKDAKGARWDPTQEQYTDFGLEPPYAEGRNVGFLTRKPSRRARLILSRAGIPCATA